MKYERGNLLVPDDEYKNLTTYMRQLHEYYMAQATETEDFGFEVIIHSPHVFIILKTRSSMSIGSACSSYTRNALSIHKC